uniref:Uncharacterized protein n=1 Tax=Leersia perrieri TaxID=77586 RepID=A0A0D9WSB0_9ORYZ
MYRRTCREARGLDLTRCRGGAGDRGHGDGSPPSGGVDPKMAAVFFIILRTIL